MYFKKKLIFITVLLLTMSCGVPSFLDTIPGKASDEINNLLTEAPPVEDLIPDLQSEKRCGDLVCDGPENEENCKIDCLLDSGVLPEDQNIENLIPEDLLSENLIPDELLSEDTDMEVYQVLNPSSNVLLHVLVLRPENWDGAPLPTLVLVPGGVSSGSKFTVGKNEAQQMALQGYTIVVFDPDGRGESAGEEDYNGFIHQDGLAAVVDFITQLPQVDQHRIGMVSYSYGITMASGTLARYPELPVIFLIDWEGPANREDTTTGCTPGSRINWEDCENQDFWEEREAQTFIENVRIPYQRLQNQKDHVQPDLSHALDMINAAVDGEPPWVRLNNYAPDQKYDPLAPPEMLSNQGTSPLWVLILTYSDFMFTEFAP
ncbi:MAG: hypothetical protein JEZ06_05785 [Anaerolineaceae bacterium]|nr:hypothetical protein [Anaerolineaceae bacterium]